MKVVSCVLGFGVVFGAIVACGTSQSSPSGQPKPDASDGAPSPVGDGGVDEGSLIDAAPPPAYPAFQPTMPQILDGGTFMTQPKIVNISFMNDPLEGDLDTFATAMANTTYWADRTKEYGIAPPSVGARIHDPTVWPATVDDSAIQTWLLGQLAGDAGVAAGWPAPDSNTVYALYFPPNVGLTYASLGMGPSCTSWHGYHSNITLPNNQGIAYAVVSRCNSIPEDPAATGIQYISAVASHEVVEAITDPLLISGTRGYFGTDPALVAFEFATGAEIMDMCALIPDGSGTGAFYTPSDFPYIVQRGWSNSAARQWKDPCLPAPAGEVYFNSTPVLTDAIPFQDELGFPVTTKGVKLPIGQTKTIEIDLWSDGPTTAEWNVVAVETVTKSLSLSLDKKTGHNGDKLHLTIEAKTANSSKAELVVIGSKLGGQGAFWPFLVVN